ncbi:MAG: urease accessory protein UreE [Aestuariivita sp.]|nr:urease accessory protein UreE [Aestuariivita sp.]
MDLPVCREITNACPTSDDTVVLDYEARFLRRKILTCESGFRFMVDFAKTTSVYQDQTFVLEDERKIGIIPAKEELLQITGELAKFAWHIGNRHAPCQIERHRLLIQKNHVIKGMLDGLGASVTSVNEPFEPERGAYGLGRAHGHAH